MTKNRSIRVEQLSEGQLRYVRDADEREGREGVLREGAAAREVRDSDVLKRIVPIGGGRGEGRSPRAGATSSNQRGSYGRRPLVHVGGTQTALAEDYVRGTITQITVRHHVRLPSSLRLDRLRAIATLLSASIVGIDGVAAKRTAGTGERRGGGAMRPYCKAIASRFPPYG